MKKVALTDYRAENGKSAGICYDAQNRAVRIKESARLLFNPELATILKRKKKGEPISSDRFPHLVIPLDRLLRNLCLSTSFFTVLRSGQFSTIRPALP
jgi:hypothetical protein